MMMMIIVISFSLHDVSSQSQCIWRVSLDDLNQSSLCPIVAGWVESFRARRKRRSCRGCPTEKHSTLYQSFFDSDMGHSLSCSKMGLVDMSTQFAGSIVLPNNNRYRIEGRGKTLEDRISNNWKMVLKKFLFKESIPRLYHLSCFRSYVSSLLASICVDMQHFITKKPRLHSSRLDVLMVVNFGMRIFLFASPCDPVNFYQHFGYKKHSTNVSVTKLLFKCRNKLKHTHFFI